MQDANGVLAIVDYVGGNAYLTAALIAAMAAVIIFGLPLLQRPLPRRRRP